MLVNSRQLTFAWLQPLLRGTSPSPVAGRFDRLRSHVITALIGANQRHEVQHPGPRISIMRFSSIKKLLSLVCLLACFSIASGTSPLADDAPHAPGALAAELLRAGTDLELNRQWLEAVQHYEKACRVHHDD